MKKSKIIFLILGIIIALTPAIALAHPSAPHGGHFGDSKNHMRHHHASHPPMMHRHTPPRHHYAPPYYHYSYYPYYNPYYSGISFGIGRQHPIYPLGSFGAGFHISI